MSKAKVTNHVTGPVDIKFMAVARPFNNQKSGKSEYSIKALLDSSDQAVSHLREVAEYKVDTKTNRNSTDKSKVTINFMSSLQDKDGNYVQPKVMDVDGNVLTGADIPFFDGRTDTGTAIVTYSVIDYGDNKIVRLSGVKLLELNLAPREEGGATTNEIEQLLKTSG